MARFKMKIITKAAAKRLAVFFAVLLAAVLTCRQIMLAMPGESYSGPLDPLTPAQETQRDLLKEHVNKLAGEIGQRNFLNYPKLTRAADYIESVLNDSGYRVDRVRYKMDGLLYDNLVAQIRGSKEPNNIVVIGAHYDSAENCPGANDNASGVASMLVMARSAKSKIPACTVRFVAFPNEEPPFFKSNQMGSLVYARYCLDHNDKVIAMLSLETLGCYFDEPGTQHYPFPFSAFYPDRANFIGFVGNVSSRRLVKDVIGIFRSQAKFPSLGAALPSSIVGVAWSDHWSFWQAGYPAVMVTDTAPFRYAHYHQRSDTSEKLDYNRLARVVSGLTAVLDKLSAMEPNNVPAVEASNTVIACAP
jgi:hypothetical protein